MIRSTYSHKGFTLIEIIVVVAIISIMASFAAISITTAVGNQQRLTNVAERIAAAVEVAAEEALLSGHPIGIKLSRSGFSYEILHQGEWSMHQRGRIFTPYEFDDDLVLTVNAAESASGSDHPNLVLLPDGERLLQGLVLTDSQSDQALNLRPLNGSYAFHEANR